VHNIRSWSASAVKTSLIWRIPDFVRYAAKCPPSARESDNRWDILTKYTAVYIALHESYLPSPWVGDWHVQHETQLYDDRRQLVGIEQIWRVFGEEQGQRSVNSRHNQYHKQCTIYRARKIFVADTLQWQKSNRPVQITPQLLTLTWATQSWKTAEERNSGKATVLWQFILMKVICERNLTQASFTARRLHFNTKRTRWVACIVEL
jgi:hypothetical protein